MRRSLLPATGCKVGLTSDGLARTRRLRLDCRGAWDQILQAKRRNEPGECQAGDQERAAAVREEQERVLYRGCIPALSFSKLSLSPIQRLSPSGSLM
jgi:hypothetical protein